ncbi:MAG: hypothetical protein AAGD10_02625 [Myxococcota bacterium]
MRWLIALGAVFSFSVAAWADGPGKCEWCLPPDFEDQVQVPANHHYAHYMPATKGRWYAMVMADAEFQLTVTGDASTPDCEPMEGQGHGMLCSFELSSDGQITVVIQAGATPVNGALSVGRGAENQ